MGTQWPRPTFPNDFLTAALIRPGYVLGQAEGDPTAQLKTHAIHISLLEGVSLVPGTFYEIVLAGQLKYDVVVPPASQGSALQASLLIEASVNGEVKRSSQTFNTSIGISGTASQVFTDQGYFFADPDLYKIGDEAMINLTYYIRDNNGSPTAQVSVSGGVVDTIFGIRGIGDSKHLKIY